jgi:hypothetical protein
LVHHLWKVRRFGPAYGEDSELVQPTSQLHCVKTDSGRIKYRFLQIK